MGEGMSRGEGPLSLALHRLVQEGTRPWLLDTASGSLAPSALSGAARSPSAHSAGVGSAGLRYLTHARISTRSQEVSPTFSSSTRTPSASKTACATLTTGLLL